MQMDQPSLNPPVGGTSPVAVSARVTALRPFPACANGFPQSHGLATHHPTSLQSSLTMMVSPAMFSGVGGWVSENKRGRYGDPFPF